MPSRIEASSHVQNDLSKTPARKKRSIRAFFLLVFGLTIPFWVLGALTGIELLPGLPVAAFAVVCPALAAAILMLRENKTAGVVALLKRAFDAERVQAKIWYAPTLLLMPMVMTLSYILLRLMAYPCPLHA